jgi:glycerol-3-phosphate dehydrogenase
MDCEVLIVGAGIHGAAVAQAAAAAGYRTLLLEQYAQPAQGTSSKSSKLIHGGLRYLESGQFRLVRECLVERARLLHNAPHLVELKPFCIPVYADTQRRAWQIRAGLGLYALLGGKRFATLPRAQWARLDGLRTAGLQTVFRYYDAQTDDAALTRAVCASAVSLGAEIRYRHSFAQARCDKHGCRVRYRSQDNSGELHTAVLVNAAGAWVNELLQHVEPAPTRLDIDMVQGTHIVIPGRLQQGIYYMEAPGDRRAIFAMPWQGNTMIGTTELQFRGDPAEVCPLQAEIDYLLAVRNHYFEPRADTSEVIEAFAGLRILPHSEGSAFHRSRDTQLHVDRARCPRVLSIYGGKLTSHRMTAERVIARIRPLLPRRTARADTRTLRLPV